MRKATWIVLIKQAYSIVLKRERLLKGMTQERLAAESGLFHSYIRKLERGLCMPSLDTFLRISKGLGIPHLEMLSMLLDELARLEAQNPS